MTISLPLDVDAWPDIKILTKPKWSSEGDWTPQPYVGPLPPPGRAGFELIRFTRVTLPDISMCVLRWVYGRINGRDYGPDEDGVLQTPDLDGYEVRVLGKGNDGMFRTIWWGTVEQQLETDCAPGADFAYATREYHCSGGIKRTKRWPLARHGFYLTTEIKSAVGHPGFNVARWDGRISGNRESSGAFWNAQGDLGGTILATPTIRCLYHTYPGCGLLWTDLQAAETALAAARPKGEVLWYFTGETGLLSGTSAWAVNEGDTAFDLLERMCRRQRGRGLVFEDWDETPAVDDIPIDFVPKLVIRSQFSEDLTYTPPGGGGEITLPGAESAGTTVAVDLIGDYRMGEDGASGFVLGTRGEHVVEYLETLGEHIEVVITPSFKDPTPSWAVRWEPSEATGYQTASIDGRMNMRYDPVYQMFGLPKDWNGQVGDGNGGAATRCDFRCIDNGDILQAPSTAIADISAPMVQVLRDIPMYCEYDYSVNPPVRHDGLTRDPTPPARRSLQLFWRVAEDRYLPLVPIPAQLAGSSLAGVSYHVTEYGLKIFVCGDDVNGVRTIGDTTIPALGSQINHTDVVPTIALKLPHRMRMASTSLVRNTVSNDDGTPDTIRSEEADRIQSRRSLRIQHRNLHLWLIHSKAAYDIDPATSSLGGFAVKRGAVGSASGSPAPGYGILRDDRAALAQLHHLAWSWYGAQRRTVRWSRHCCGLLPSATTEDADGNTQQTPYEQLGSLVSSLSAMGSDYVINTPITAIHYDHVNGITNWITDWSSLDFS